jgi:hypothetical protein
MDTFDTLAIFLSSNGLRVNLKPHLSLDSFRGTSNLLITGFLMPNRIL